jgi:hypothetical protein
MLVISLQLSAALQLFTVDEMFLSKPVTLQLVVIKGEIRTVLPLDSTKGYGGSEGTTPLGARSWVSNPRSSKLYYTARGHTYELYMYYKTYTKI